MFTQKNPGLQFPFRRQVPQVFPFCEKLTSSVAVYRRAQLIADLPQRRKNNNRSLWKSKEINQLLERPWIRSTVKRLRSPCSAADAVSGVSREETRRDIKIFLPLFIYRALGRHHSTTCVRHWRRKIYNFPIVSVQHCTTCFPRKPQTVQCMRRALVN